MSDVQHPMSATPEGTPATGPVNKADIIDLTGGVQSAGTNQAADVREAELRQTEVRDGDSRTTDLHDADLHDGDLRGTEQHTGDLRAAVDLDRADGDGTMVLHEERLVAGVERVATGRVVLRKRIVEEERTITVRVRREEVEVVTEDLASAPEANPLARRDASAAADDQRVTDADRRADRRADSSVAGIAPEAAAGERVDADGTRWIVLHEERPRIEMDVVPVERVRLAAHQTLVNQEFTAEVAREVVDLQTESLDMDGNGHRPIVH